MKLWHLVILNFVGCSLRKSGKGLLIEIVNVSRFHLIVMKAHIWYHAALSMWYSAGPGSPFSAALGMGWVQELVSRLTQTRITDFNTSVNQTIVSSETLFPLDQPIYVDASHDTVMSASQYFVSVLYGCKEMAEFCSFKYTWP